MLRGSAEQTRAQAEQRCAGVSDVLWASGSLRRHLGRSCAGVVLDFHAGVDLDQLGMAHGMVRAGGVLVLRLPQVLDGRVGARLEAALATAPLVEALGEASPITGGSLEQAGLVERLREDLDGDRHIVLTAARGRGKSAAVGLALAGRNDAVVVSDDRRQAATLQQFAPDVPWVAPDALEVRRWVVVEEAAALPVPLLRHWVQSHPQRRFVFVTTTDGYEGHGRGFSLRFLPWLREQSPVEHTLTMPVRWGVDDPLERWVHRLLVLDAEPVSVDGPLQPRRLGREEIDEPTLRQVFGLLVQAHYRTSPRDLQLLLDAPDLHVHALEGTGGVAGVCQLVEEGRLTAAQVAKVDRGERVRAQALAEWLVVEGEADLARRQLLRSVRTTVLPDRQGEGWGRRLVAHVHEAHRPEAFGTLFGVTLPLLQWRRALGYRLCGLSWGRSGRSGEPSALMLRPCSAAATAAVERLRGRLARDLPLWLALQQAQQPLDPALVSALREDLPEPAPMDTKRRVASYLAGHRTLEWAGTALLASGRGLPEAARARLVEHRPWRSIAQEQNTTVRALMRQIRRELEAGQTPT